MPPQGSRVNGRALFRAAGRFLPWRDPHHPLAKAARPLYLDGMKLLPVGLACLGLCACVEKDIPNGDDGAAYFGLAPDTTRTYADGALTETHTVKESNVGSKDGVAVDLVAKDSGGFVVQGRSMTFEFTGETSFLRRFNDCLNPCAEAASPIAFLDWPLVAGAQKETEATVTLTQNGTETGTEEQAHTVIVGDEAEVTVPAGSFDAFSVTWTINTDGEVQTHILSIAPEEGIVRWQTPDGRSLEQSSDG